MSNFINAIKSLTDIPFNVIGDDIYENIEWLGSGTVPTKEEVSAKEAEVKTQWEYNEYQRNRRYNYPDIGDQLDDLYHSGAFSSDMAAKIKAVKDAYPKPSS
jgi:hypothetical protein